MQYKFPKITNTNNTILILKENLYMKTTGIVRRIETRVIITQKPLKAT